MRYILVILVFLFVFLWSSAAGAQHMGNSYYNYLLRSGRVAEAQVYLQKINAYNARINADPVFRAREAQRIREAQILHQRMMHRHHHHHWGHHHHGHVGYYPVITWLPSGTYLGASAVVSPDRRYVRFGGTVMFSQVGPVRTFTFRR